MITERQTLLARNCVRKPVSVTLAAVEPLEMNRRDLLGSAFAAAIMPVKTLARDSAVIAVLGTGRVGAALGQQLAARAGVTIIYGSRSPDSEAVRELVRRTGPQASATSYQQAVAGAGIVLLALPWHATEEVVRALEPGDRIVIDPINALRIGAGG
jgi:D-arabinose 1-dehydrogenase-like Zn-dependent alcohol dehydrogenase